MTDTPTLSQPNETAAFTSTTGVKPLVAVVFTHNDATTLERCLASVAQQVAEVWVIDTGSTDETVAIAKRFTPHVYYAPPQHDPWLLWQEALTALRHDYPNDAWLLWLEPTDWLPKESQQQLERWHRLEAPTATGGFLLKQVLHHWTEQPLRWGKLTHHDCRLALLSAIRPDDHPVFCGWVMEKTEPLMGVILHHQPYQNLHPLLQGAIYWGRRRHYQRHALGQPTKKPPGMMPFLATLTWHWHRYLCYLDGPAGLVWALARSITRVV